MHDAAFVRGHGHLRRHTAWVDPAVQLWNRTFIENLRFDTVLRARNEQSFETVFERLGIARLAPLPVRLLSAGQQRRVALARLLLSATPLWLVDEPFTNLDREGRSLVLELVDEHLDGGGMCIMAAHQDVHVRNTVRSVRL